MSGSEHIYVFEGFRLNQNIPCLYRLDKGDKTPVALGDRENSAEQLQQAVGAFNAALSVYAPPGLEHYRQKCETDRDRAVSLLKQRRGPNRDLDAAK
jgi:hypothetical protein